MMTHQDDVCIYSSANRDRIQAVAEALRWAGIRSVLLRSDRASGTWDIEVSPDDVAVAREVIEGLRAF
jgi:hypothetical protein